MRPGAGSGSERSGASVPLFPPPDLIALPPREAWGLGGAPPGDIGAAYLFRVSDRHAAHLFRLPAPTAADLFRGTSVPLNRSAGRARRICSASCLPRTRHVCSSSLFRRSGASVPPPPPHGGTFVPRFRVLGGPSAAYLFLLLSLWTRHVSSASTLVAAHLDRGAAVPPPTSSGGISAPSKQRARGSAPVSASIP